MPKKSALYKIVSMNLLSLYLAFALFVPFLNTFTVKVFSENITDVPKNISLIKALSDTKNLLKVINDSFINTTKANTVSEIFWYAMMLLILGCIILIISSLVALLGKSKASALKSISLGSVLTGLAFLAMGIIIVIVRTMQNSMPEGEFNALSGIVELNIPFFILNLLAAVGIFVLTLKTFKDFKERKLSEMNKK